MLRDKVLDAVLVLFIGVAVWGFATIKPVEKPTPPPVVYSAPVPETPSHLGTDKAKTTIKSDDLKSYLSFLASDTCAGRKPGTPGWEQAKSFVVNKFKEFGLTPVNQNYLQPFQAGSINTENIIGYVAGTDPALTNEIVIVGAHLDHLGQRGGRTFYGADDNGSGSVSMLEIAQAISQMKLKRTVVFMSFSAEEMGLLGSKHYVEHPLFPLKNVVLMVNLDMVGYLKGKSSLEAIGVRSEFFKKMIDECDNGYPFVVQPTAQISGGSDHAPFARAGIPVMFLFTGIHGNYHQPTDTIEKVDFVGMENIAKFAFDVVVKTADWPDKIATSSPKRRL